MTISYDAGHFSFLELIKVIHDTTGPAFVKGALIKTGMSAAERAPVQDFESFDAFLESVFERTNPIAGFEGAAQYYGEGIFGLPACPFAASIKTFLDVAGALPQEYQEVTAQINRPSAITEKLRVGTGAAVSPFCGVHQPIRSAFGDRITIAGHPLTIYQLGCKSGSGKKGLAMRWIEEAGVDPELVDRILDDNMCCYAVRIQP